jgi:hypothetical protein
MDELDAYAKYERAWNDPDHAPELLADTWADAGVYADDDVPDGLVGREALVELIRAQHRQFPGLRLWATSKRMLAGRLAVTWSGAGDDPGTASSGTDVIEFDADGRILRVTDVLTID